MGFPADVKYIDPTYMIRACRANASDGILCTVLGQNAVSLLLFSPLYQTNMLIPFVFYGSKPLHKLASLICHNER